MGPLFNDQSCVACHIEPRIGGTGPEGLATVVRVGELTREGLFVVGRRGPVAPAHAISELGVACDREAGIPAGVNVTSVRNAPALFGRALIDAISDDVIRAGAVPRGDGVRGRAEHRAFARRSRGRPVRREVTHFATAGVDGGAGP